MRKLLSILTIALFFIGTQAILLGALYKIQSWEMPEIGGLTINLLAVGLVIEGTALTLMILKNNWSDIASEERLTLDGDRLQKIEKRESLRSDEDLFL